MALLQFTIRFWILDSWSPAASRGGFFLLRGAGTVIPTRSTASRRAGRIWFGLHRSGSGDCGRVLYYRVEHGDGGTDPTQAAAIP